MGGKFQVGASPVSVVRVFQRNKNSRMDGQIDRWIDEWMIGNLFQGIGFTQLHFGLVVRLELSDRADTAVSGRISSSSGTPHFCSEDPLPEWLRSTHFIEENLLSLKSSYCSY